MRRFAILIPTYGRSDVLRENLSAMLPILSPRSIPIYISDDTFDESVRQVVNSFGTDLLFYRKNFPSLGHDANILSSLQWVEADFVWLLGDACYFNDDQLLDQIFHGIDAGCDLICLNHDSKILPKDRMFNGQAEAAEFFVENAWHQTLTGTTIYGPTLLSALKRNPLQFNFSNFPQYALCLASLQIRHPSILWLAKIYLRVNPRKTGSYWRTDFSRIVSVFGVDWLAVNRAWLPGMELRQLDRIVRGHSAHRGVFDFRFFLKERGRGCFGYKDILEFWDLWPRISSLNRFLMLLISVFPVTIVRFIYSFR